MPKTTLEGHEVCTAIVIEGVSAFRALDNAGLFKIPAFCFLRGEKEEREQSINDCIDSVLHVAQAGYEKHSDSYNHTGVATPPNPTLPDLGSLHSHPIGNCLIDSSAMYLRDYWRRKWSGRATGHGSRVQYKQTLFNDVVDLAFQVTLLAIVGQKQHFDHYAQFLSNKNLGWDWPLVPRINNNEVQAYIKFLQDNPNALPGTDCQCIEPFYSPLCSVTGYPLFVDRLQDGLQNVLSEVLLFAADASPTLEREDVRRLLEAFLRQCAGDAAPTDLPFLAQKLMLDLEDICDGLFKAPTLSDAATAIPWRNSGAALDRVLKTGAVKTREKALSLMLAVLNDKAMVYLACFGAKKNTGDAFARWAVNGRPVDVYDMDQFLHMVRSCRRTCHLLRAGCALN